MRPSSQLLRVKRLAASLVVLWSSVAAAAPWPPRVDLEERRALDLDTVLPVLPGKNTVRWWEFDWRWTEFTPVAEGAPVRLYFYEEERTIAELAAPSIHEAYVDFVEGFQYRPTRRIPFLLYNSHFEFESTTAFFISEQVLGVTSTQDLTMALPYWGERERFLHVMRHELAHQFTIQKVVDLGREAGCNPLAAMPLWFVEGLAELFSQPGLTAQARATLADQFLHTELRQGERGELPGFFDQGPLSFERVYLIGHAQNRFLEETFGPGTVRRLLERSGEMCASVSPFFGVDPADAPFTRLVEEVTQTGRDELDRRWKAWARAAVESALNAPQQLDGLEVIEDLGLGEIDSFSVSPDGRVIFFRAFDRDTGIARLYLRDLDSPGSLTKVTEDSRLRLESVHPLDRRVTALGRDRLAWIGRTGATDRLHVARWRRIVDGDRVRFELSDRREHDLEPFDLIIEAGWPAIDPRTGAVAFSGLSRGTGFLDVYRMDEPFDRAPRVRKLTHSPYAEQDLVYGPGGTLFLASDATPDARFEVMVLSPTGPDALTSFAGEAQAREPALAG
jgi:hypothetical protein